MKETCTICGNETAPVTRCKCHMYFCDIHLHFHQVYGSCKFKSEYKEKYKTLDSEKEKKNIKEEKEKEEVDI